MTGSDRRPLPVLSAIPPALDYAGAAREDPDEYERHFDPRTAVQDFAEDMQRRAPFNQAALRDARTDADIAYGDHPRHRLDVYRATGDGAHAVHVFFHGGYWRSGDKTGLAFVGASLARQGITTVIPNYALCPAASLDETVASALAAFRWVLAHATALGGDPGRVTLSGHSAGAHLCASILAGIDPASLPPDARLRGAVLLSGCFDPEPALHARINGEIGLDADVVRRHDMERAVPRLDCPIVVMAGGREPSGWIDLSLRYVGHLRASGRDPGFHLLPGRHHFNALDLYRQPDSPICRAIRAQTENDHDATQS